MSSHLLFISFIFTLCFVSICCIRSETEDSKTNELENSIRNNFTSKGQKWITAEKNLRKLISYATKAALRSMNSEDITKLTPRCFSHLMKIGVGLRQLKIWAFRFIDTMGKIPVGSLRGSSVAMGDFDGCLEINVTGSFQGKSCILELIPPFPEVRTGVGVIDDIPELDTAFSPDTLFGSINSMLKPYYQFGKLKIAICVPSSCGEDDVTFLAQTVLSMLKMEWDVKVNPCQVKEGIKFEEWSDYVSLFILGLAVLLVTTATVTDVSMLLLNKTEGHRKDSSYPVRLILCFSIYWNTEKLLKQNESKESIRIFNGMKVVTILWVILCHTYAFVPVDLYSNSIYIRDMLVNPAAQFIANGYLNVDTFFFMGGFLVMSTCLKKNAPKVNILMYIIMRIWRLTPPVIFIIALKLILYRLGSGPFWQILFEPMYDKCLEKWWATLLYVNNFYGYDMCAGWTWYVAVDMQLFIISFLVLITLKSHAKLSLSTLGALLLLSFAAIPLNQIYYNLPPFVTPAYSITKGDVEYWLNYGYVLPHLHAFVYFSGMAFAYFLYHYKSLIRISSTMNIIGWFLCLGFGTTAAYSSYFWHISKEVSPVLVSAMYSTAMKLVWPLCLGWIVISCCTGNGGFITTLLSWSPLTQLSRLTYATYLVHPLIIASFYSSSRIPIQMDHRTIIMYYLGFVMSSFLSAYVLSMMFEAPFMAMEKIFILKRITNSSTFADKNKKSKLSMSNQDCEKF